MFSVPKCILISNLFAYYIESFVFCVLFVYITVQTELCYILNTRHASSKISFMNNIDAAVLSGKVHCQVDSVHF